MKDKPHVFKSYLAFTIFVLLLYLIDFIYFPDAALFTIDRPVNGGIALQSTMDYPLGLWLIFTIIPVGKINQTLQDNLRIILEPAGQWGFSYKAPPLIALAIFLALAAYVLLVSAACPLWLFHSIILLDTFSTLALVVQYYQDPPLEE